MNNISLRFSDVSFEFHKNGLLFENINLFLENNDGNGKIIALMGPSGIGKTTFCELALGIRKPQRGSIEFSPKNLNIAVIPQKGIVFEELSIEENIACLRHSTTLGQTFREERILEAANSLGLMDILLKSKSSKLSGGEAQRVMLARIQTIDCNLLILDEPCSFLDNKVKSSFLAQIRHTIDKSRMLALLVTHIWDEVQLIADEVIFFNRVNGRTVALPPVTPTDAADHPPTIDALYGIWWPNCRHINFDDAIKVIDKPIPNYPSSTCYIGLHSLKSTPQSTQNEWARKLWNLMENHPDVNKQNLLSIKNKYNSVGHIFVNFYDKNGMLVANDKEVIPKILAEN